MSVNELIELGYGLEEATEIVRNRQRMEAEIDAEADAEGYAVRRSYRSPFEKRKR